MEPFRVNDICAVVGGRLLQGDGESLVAGFFSDSRKAGNEDCLFVPLKGENFDGHDYIAAVAAGAKGLGAFVEPSFDGRIENNDFVLIEVEDSLTALQIFAAFNRAQYDIPVIAVTGTVGKTTTKEFMRMAAGAKAVVSEASFNNHIGVPMTLLGIGSDTSLCVAEVGTNAPGEISLLSKLVCPTIAIVTNVGECHLEGLGSVENVALEKACIVDGMNAGAKVLVCADCPLALDAVRKRAREKDIEVISFGFDDEADFKAVAQEGGSFLVESRFIDETLCVKINIPGRHNIMNALGALSALVLAGLPAAEIVKSLGGRSQAKLRWEERNVCGRKFILDCYNANPLSVRAALETFAGVQTSGRKIFVLGNMYELGKDEVRLHAALAANIKASGAQVLVTVGELAREAGLALAAEGFGAEKIFNCADSRQSAELLARCSAEGDTILVKGSRRNKMEQIADIMEKDYAGVTK